MGQVHTSIQCQQQTRLPQQTNISWGTLEATWHFNRIQNKPQLKLNSSSFECLNVAYDSL